MSSSLDQVWALIKYFMAFSSDGTAPAKLEPSLGHPVSVIITFLPFPARSAFGICFLCIAINRTDDGHPKRITVD